MPLAIQAVSFDLSIIKFKQHQLSLARADINLLISRVGDKNNPSNH